MTFIGILFIYSILCGPSFIGLVIVGVTYFNAQRSVSIILALIIGLSLHFLSAYFISLPNFRIGKHP